MLRRAAYLAAAGCAPPKTLVPELEKNLNPPDERATRLASGGAPCPARKLMGRLVVVFLASAALATLYQIGKHVLFPHITLWQSHDLTIGLIAVLATAASCYVLVNRAKSVPRPVAEAAARKCEEKYCSLVNNIPEVVWTFDDRGRVVFVSPSIELLSGYSREEIYERGVALFLDCVHPDDLGVVRAGLEALFASGQPYDVECRIHNKNGDWMWVHDRALGTYE